MEDSTRERQRCASRFSLRTSGFWLSFFGCRSERGIHGGPDRDKLVAGAVDGSDVDGIRRVKLQLLPQLKDVIVHGARRRITLISPNMIQQFAAGEDAFGVLHKITEGLEL